MFYVIYLPILHSAIINNAHRYIVSREKTENHVFSLKTNIQ